MTTLSSLFSKAPTVWGLRGDPYLWEDMKAALECDIMPQTPAELEQIIRAAFVELTGRSWDDPTPIFIEKYAHGGMSSGMVCPGFWKDTVVPLLASRHRG